MIRKGKVEPPQTTTPKSSARTRRTVSSRPQDRARHRHGLGQDSLPSDQKVTKDRNRITKDTAIESRKQYKTLTTWKASLRESENS